MPDWFDPYKSRASLALASMSPGFVWVLSSAKLANVGQVLLWFGISAVLSSCAPRNLFKLNVVLFVLSVPAVLIWISVVSLTGFGPGESLLVSVTTSSASEWVQTLGMIYKNSSFVVTSVVLIILTYYAVRHVKSVSERGNAVLSSLFFVAVCSFGIVSLDDYPMLKSLVSPETRDSVPYLSMVETMKSGMTIYQNSFFDMGSFRVKVRKVSDAKKTYDAQKGFVVLVVGESLRADALLSFERGEWSKKMLERIEGGAGGIRLPNACSGGNATFVSVPRLLTGSDVDDDFVAESAPTILAQAKVAGETTAIISNHEDMVVNEIGHDWMIKTSSSERNAFDESAVDALSSFSRKTDGVPAAAWVHLYGQHFVYSDRYPKGMFDKEQENISSSNKEELQYARAAEYGVKVLLGMAEILDARTDPSVLIFTSDHGENLESDMTGKKYHALNFSGKNDTTVPVLVLWNKAFVESGRAETVKRLSKKNGLIAHKDLADLFLSLTGKDIMVSPSENPRTISSGRAVPCSSLPD